VPKTERVKRGIAVVPTLLTLGNGFCGFLAISKMVDAITIGNGEGFTEKILQAAWLIFLAMIFDALDGRVARLTNQASDFGVQLDSLNDVVSFGVAPALLVKVVYEHALVEAGIPFNLKLTLLLSSLFVLCAILRLARFSLDTDASDTHGTFSGLPTPAAAALLASAVFFLFEGGDSLGLKIGDPAVLILKRGFIFLPPLLGLLMICKIEYIHMVQRYVRGRKTFDYLALGLVCVFLVAFCNDWAIFLVGLLYVLSGPVMACVRLARKPRGGGKQVGH
jgi:CDP-diacylglycerol---serine O-phosphatidyltransferase